MCPHNDHKHISIINTYEKGSSTPSENSFALACRIYDAKYLRDELRHNKRRREEGKGKREQKPYSLWFPHPRHTTAGLPQAFVFATFNDALRCHGKSKHTGHHTPTSQCERWYIVPGLTHHLTRIAAMPFPVDDLRVAPPPPAAALAQEENQCSHPAIFSRRRDCVDIHHSVSRRDTFTNKSKRRMKRLLTKKNKYASFNGNKTVICLGSSEYGQ
jgi:hypothetical protein